jgi:deoxyhypusine synthase
MKKVKDFLWKENMSVTDLMDGFGSLGYQASELSEAAKVVLKMKRNGAKIFLTFTSNMVTSGLRGFFAQLCEFKIPNILVTTSGAIEEDIMKSLGEEFEVSSFYSDDVGLYEKGENRVGNLVIRNESYMKFEDWIQKILGEIYSKGIRKISSSELLKEIGLKMAPLGVSSKEGSDSNSILYRAAKNNIPIYCPGIVDSSFGFQLFMFCEKHKDFFVDSVGDMKRVVTDLSFDEKKGLISLGGSISKHYAVFSALLSGGFDYAVYLTTSHASSGSMSGATTEEAKSWGKLKDSAEAATVNGDVTITFPLMMCSVLDRMKKEGILKDE